MSPKSSTRPGLDRKHTRKTREKKQAELDTGIAVVVNGRRYAVRHGDLSAVDAMDLRRETGYSFVGLLNNMRRDPDIDQIAAIMWLSRRIDGEVGLSYLEVAQDVDYDVDIEVADPGPEDLSGAEAGDEHPEG